MIHVPSMQAKGIETIDNKQNCSFDMYLPIIILFTIFQPSIKFLRSKGKEIVATVDGNLTISLTKLLDCFFKPFIPKEVCTLHIHVQENCVLTVMQYYMYVLLTYTCTSCMYMYIVYNYVYIIQYVS